MEGFNEPPVIAFESGVGLRKAESSSLICAVCNTSLLRFVVSSQPNPLRLVLLSNRSSPDNVGSLGFDEELNALHVSYQIPSIVTPLGQAQTGVLKLPGCVTSWGSMPGQGKGPLKEPQICFAIGVIDMVKRQLLGQTEVFYLLSHKKQINAVVQFARKNNRMSLGNPVALLDVERTLVILQGHQQPPQQQPLQQQQQHNHPQTRKRELEDVNDNHDNAGGPLLHTCAEMCQASRGGPSTLPRCCLDVSPLDATTRKTTRTDPGPLDDPIDNSSPLLSRSWESFTLPWESFALPPWGEDGNGDSQDDDLVRSAPNALLSFSQHVNVYLLVGIANNWAVPATHSDMIIIPEGAPLALCAQYYSVEARNKTVVRVASVLDVRTGKNLIGNEVVVATPSEPDGNEPPRARYQQTIKIGRASGDLEHLSSYPTASLGEFHGAGWLKWIDVIFKAENNVIARKPIAFWVVKHSSDDKERLSSFSNVGTPLKGERDHE